VGGPPGQRHPSPLIPSRYDPHRTHQETPMSYDTMTGNGRTTSDQGPAATEQAREAARTAAEQGKAVAGTATDHAKELTGEARDQLQTVAGEARDQARRALSTTTDELETQFDQRLGDATAMARSRAGELRALAEGRPEEAGTTRDLVMKASQRLDTLADRADDLGVRGVVEEVSEFARRRPLLFLAGAAGAGLVVGRLARATKDSVALDQARQASTGSGLHDLGSAPTYPVGSTAIAPTAPVAPLGAPTPPAPPTAPPLPPQGPMGTGAGGQGF